MKIRIRSWNFIVAVAILAAAAYYLFRDNSLRFKEEVQLANGDLIVIDRTFKTESFGEIGGPGGWEAKFNSFVISSPVKPDNPPEWQSETGLIPIVFDHDPQTNEWFVVTTFYSCQAWYNLGRPKLPYAEFRFRNGKWQKVELSPELIGRKANVMTGVRSGGEPKLLTLPQKKIRDADTRIAREYTKIVSKWTTGCPGAFAD